MKPFLQGKKALNVTPMRLPPGFGPTPKNVGAGPRPPAHAHAPGENHGASVETVKEGDKVVRLIVTCVCGERVEIECLYNAGH
jgi:hypothetical protein